MNGMQSLEEMLSGGHPNSLGRTLEVVDAVLKDRQLMDQLFGCYESSDPVVRLRTSNAMKRIEVEKHAWIIPYIDRLIDEIGPLDQASAQWTLAQLFLKLSNDLSARQRSGALAIMKRNIAENDDWIVLNTTMDTLSAWASADDGLRTWLTPHVKRLANDRRKSVAKRAAKTLVRLTAR